MEVNDGTVTATSNGGYSIYIGGNTAMEVSDGTVTATGNNISGYGIFINSANAKALSVTGGTVEATATGNGGNGININGNTTMEVSGGTVTATGNGGASSHGICLNSGASLTVSNGEVTATSNGTTSHGICLYSGTSLTVNDGTVTATGNSYGIYGTVNFNGGHLTAKSTGTSAAFTEAPAIAQDLSYRWRTADTGDWNLSSTTPYTYSNSDSYVELEVYVAATGITLNPTSLTLTEGQTGVLTATVTPGNSTDTVTWTSDNTAVATVDANGTVTAVAPGTATITATAGTVSASCTVTVKPATVDVTGVTLDRDALTLAVDGTAQLTATVTPSDATDQTVIWSSSDTNVATVDENGVVTAVGVGSATITVTTTEGSYTDTCAVTVTQPVTGVTLDRDELSLTVGRTETLTATVTPDNASDKTVTWSSSDETVATVDENGVVTAVGVGSATITVTTTDGDHTATCAVTVSRPYTPPVGPSQPDGPSTGSSDGWQDIQEEIGQAQDGETITIDMDGETQVPGEIFEEVAGKDVDVTFDLGDGLSWTVNGQDVPEGIQFSDLDLGVGMGTSGIPVNVINAITGAVSTVQITLAHDGAFGFTLTLTAPMGRENSGLWANLYHYRDGVLVFETSSTIDRNGNVSLQFSHASQFAIVIDDHSHDPEAEIDLPFTDVTEGAWYEEAVGYVYQSGLMNGTSETTFAPEATTTRAMIWTVLARLNGQNVDGGTPWYALAQAWAMRANISDGTNPESAISREELATMLYRAAGSPAVSGNFLAYSDGNSVSTWAESAMLWATQNGIIEGISGSLAPQGEATRAQVAAMLQRYLEALAA